MAEPKVDIDDRERNKRVAKLLSLVGDPALTPSTAANALAASNWVVEVRFRGNVWRCGGQLNIFVAIPSDVGGASFDRV